MLAALRPTRRSPPIAEEGPTAYEQNEVRAIFLDGKVAMIQAGGRVLPTALKEAKINWGVAPLPLGPAAKGQGTLLITDSLAVFKGTGVEDKATEFAKYITSPEIQPSIRAAGRRGPHAAAAVGRRSTSWWQERPVLEAVHRRHQLSAGRSRCSPTTRASRTS